MDGAPIHDALLRMVGFGGGRAACLQVGLKVTKYGDGDSDVQASDLRVDDRGWGMGTPHACVRANDLKRLRQSVPARLAGRPD